MVLPDICWEGAYSSAEMESVYSTAPADWDETQKKQLKKCK